MVDLKRAATAMATMSLAIAGGAFAQSSTSSGSGGAQAETEALASPANQPAGLPANFEIMKPAGGSAAHLDATAPDCRPRMPLRAEHARAQGTSVLGFMIDQRGQVVAAGILKPSGHSPEHRLLDRAALDALLHCPIKVGSDAAGQPAATSVIVAYQWRLN